MSELRTATTLNVTLRRIQRRMVGWLAQRDLGRIGVKWDSPPMLIGWPLVSLHAGSRIHLGKEVTLCSWSEYTALGVNHPVVIRTLAPGAEIVIGDRVGISGATICAAESLTIGAECLLGANVTIVDTDFHPLAPQGRRAEKDLSRVSSSPVVIGRNVFIGAGTLVLKGVTIGADSVIGAGSLVSQDIPSGVIAAGNPCRVVRAL